MPKKIFIKTFGCQMNEYDSDRILDLVKKVGYFPTKNVLETDCYILNTCHIREKATEKVYDDIGRIKKKFRGNLETLLNTINKYETKHSNQITITNPVFMSKGWTKFKDPKSENKLKNDQENKAN